MMAITGCGSSQPKPEAPIQTTDSGETGDAAEFERLADQADNEKQRAVYQYLAAQAWLNAGFEDRAFFLLVNLDAGLLSAEQRLNRNLELANFYSARGKHLLALEYLEEEQIRIDLFNASNEQKSQWAEKTAQLSTLLGDYKRAVAAYDFALSYADEEELDSLRNALWKNLTLIDQLPKGPYLSSETQGWVALAQINNLSTGTISDQYLSYLIWQDQYFEHPAQLAPPKSFAVLERIAAGSRPKVAILLPLTGPLAIAGNAILDGYMTARAAEYDRQQKAPLDPLAPNLVKVFDTEANSLFSIIRDIEADDYDLVIGPLDKSRVADYVDLMPEIPTLALNNLPDNAFTSEKPILGLSLNVEDEAVQSGIKALQEGHQSALVLVPNSAWGDRAGQAFSDFWQAEGGDLIGIKSYGDNRTHADLLERTLHVDQSNKRKSDLQKLLGKIIEFTPRRRQDIDALFLGASPNQARQLKPMLAFFFAESIPVYSTSSVYSGVADSNADRDLDGIQFSTLPWVLQPGHPLRKSMAKNSAQTTTNLRMQAIGVDSYYLSQRLQQFLTAEDTVYRGVIGKLANNPENKNLDRTQTWAEFSKGLARSLDN